METKTLISNVSCFSSITSQAGGEANYDVGYSNVRERAVTEPSGSRLNEPAGSENLEQLYTQVNLLMQ